MLAAEILCHKLTSQSDSLHATDISVTSLSDPIANVSGSFTDGTQLILKASGTC